MTFRIVKTETSIGGIEDVYIAYENEQHPCLMAQRINHKWDYIFHICRTNNNLPSWYLQHMNRQINANIGVLKKLME